MKRMGAALTLALLSVALTLPSATLASQAWPAQIWMRVPAAPQPVRSDGIERLFYEVYLTNLSGDAATVTQFAVLDASRPKTDPLATFTGQALGEMARSFGKNETGDTRSVSIQPGQTSVLFLEVSLPAGRAAPRNIAHRVRYADGSEVTGRAISIDKSPVSLLGAPVTGADWIAADAPSNEPDNHHRRGIFVADGELTDSRRYAIDWKRVREGRPHNGDETLAASYLAYLKPVVAVADARVVEVRDGAPDNPPGHNEKFHPAVPVTFENAGGNTIVLDLGGDRYAHYYHLERGSIRVHIGDRVKRGEVMAKIGASGDAREPHLHFELTTAIPLIVGEGLPFEMERYRVTGGPGFKAGLRKRDLPRNGMLIALE